MYKNAYYLACMLYGCKSVHLPITKVPSTARESVAVVPIAMKQTSEPVCARGGMETNATTVSITLQLKTPCVVHTHQYTV